MIIYMMVLAFGLFFFCCMQILLEGYGNRKDSVKRRLTAISQQQDSRLYLDEDFNKSLSERIVKPMAQGLWKKVKKYIPQENDEDLRNTRLKSMLRRSGMKISLNEYNVLRMAVMCGSAIFFAVYGLFSRLSTVNVLLLAIVGLYFSYVLLRFQITSRASKRKEAMEKQLPEVLDTLSVSVEAGLGLEQAMAELANHFQGALIDEIAITNREISMGRNRKEALLALGDRCEFDEMKNFVRSIVQAMGMGVSIKNVLHTQAGFMRQSRRNKVEEKAMKVSVKILIPMALFIFPVMFIILLGPALINIFNTL